MKTFVLCCAVLLLAQMAFAQSSPTVNWYRSFDGSADLDQVTATAVDAHNNVYAAGWIKKSASDYDWFLVKYTSGGIRKFFTYCFTATGMDKPKSLFIQGANIYIAGIAKNGGTHLNAYIDKWDTSGTHLLTTTASDLSANVDIVGMSVDGSGYLFAGGTVFTSGNPNFFITRWSPDGSSPVTATCTFNSYDTCKAMKTDAAGVFYLVGCTKVVSNVNFAVWKANHDLSTAWTRTYDGGVGRDFATNVVISNTGSVYVGGTTYFETDDYGPEYNFAVAKYYANGNLAWAVKTDWEDTQSFVTGMKFDPSSQLYFYSAMSCGDFNSDYSDGTLEKWDTTGTELWLGSNTYNLYADLAIDNSGNIWCGGSYFYMAMDVFNSSGTRLYATAYDPQFSDNGSDYSWFDYTACMTANAAGNIYLAGSMNPSLSGLSAQSGDACIAQWATGGSFSKVSTVAQVPPQHGAKQRGPSRFQLSQNYPNPFNPTTSIQYEIPAGDVINLTVYDAAGREVQSLVNDQYTEAGSYKLTFDASKMASGTYFYQLKSKNNRFNQVKKMMYVK